MARIDYYHDPNAPLANSLVPGVSAVVEDQEGRILLQRRSDNSRWALPGGVMDIGESIRDAVVREVREETGIEVEPTRIIGVYTDPRHVFSYPDGEVRQEYSVCFDCTVVGGDVHASDESTDVRFWPPDQLDQLDIHPSVRRRIQHHLERRSAPVIE